MKNNKVIFFGTAPIASNVLEALIKNHANVIAVVTTPDQPYGRKRLLKASSVKLIAQKFHIPIFQPEKVSDILEDLKTLAPDLILTCAYGKLLPESVLNLPKYRCVNIHASLLPRWRGGAPIHYCIWKRDKVTGITLMYMEKGLDTGDVLFQEQIEILKNETYDSLYVKLTHLACQMILKHFDDLFNSQIKSLKQDENLVTVSKNITREDEHLNFNESVNDIEAKIRAFYSVPMAYANYANLPIKILQAAGKKVPVDASKVNGTIIEISQAGLKIKCCDGILTILEVQLPSKKPILIKQLINGNHPFVVGKKFS